MNKVAFVISVIGLAIQGLAAIVINGTVASVNTFSGSMSQIGLSHDAAMPILWTIYAYTAAVFLVGLAGIIWLRSAQSKKVRRGATFVLISAVFAATSLWGYLLGSLLMLAGSIMGFKSIPRSTNDKR